MFVGLCNRMASNCMNGYFIEICNKKQVIFKFCAVDVCQTACCCSTRFLPTVCPSFCTCIFFQLNLISESSLQSAFLALLMCCLTLWKCLRIDCCTPSLMTKHLLLRWFVMREKQGTFGDRVEGLSGKQQFVNWWSSLVNDQLLVFENNFHQRKNNNAVISRV